jgi:hypothetical protein
MTAVLAVMAGGAAGAGAAVAGDSAVIALCMAFPGSPLMPDQLRFLILGGGLNGTGGTRGSFSGLSASRIS